MFYCLTAQEQMARLLVDLFVSVQLDGNRSSGRTERVAAAAGTSELFIVVKFVCVSTPDTSRVCCARYLTVG